MSESMDPCDYSIVETKSMEIQLESLMIYIIKSLAEIHDYNICLTSLNGTA